MSYRFSLFRLQSDNIQAQRYYIEFSEDIFSEGVRLSPHGTWPNKEWEGGMLKLCHLIVGDVSEAGCLRWYKQWQRALSSNSRQPLATLIYQTKCVILEEPLKTAADKAFSQQWLILVADFFSGFNQGTLSKFALPRPKETGGNSQSDLTVNRDYQVT